MHYTGWLVQRDRIRLYMAAVGREKSWQGPEQREDIDHLANLSLLFQADATAAAFATATSMAIATTVLKYSVPYFALKGFFLAVATCPFAFIPIQFPT